MKNQGIKNQFFQNLVNFHIKYTLSKLCNHCNQICNFYFFLGTIICFVTKSYSIYILGLCIYFIQKPVEMIPKNNSLTLSGQHMIRSVI